MDESANALYGGSGGMEDDIQNSSDPGVQGKVSLVAPLSGLLCEQVVTTGQSQEKRGM